MSGYVPCDFTPGQTVRYCQGSDRAERTIVRVLPEHFHDGMDAWTDAVTVMQGETPSTDARESQPLRASWFEAVE